MKQYSDPIENLRKLVGFRSVSNSPNLDICEWIATACTSFGFDCELEKADHDPAKANVIATIGPKTRGGLILSGHLDVVPTNGQPWKTDPFNLTEQNGRFYGRGTCDMKGFIASTLAALSLVDLNKVHKPLVLIWTYDEEIGCKGSAHHLEKRKVLQDWYPREALIGEPTDFHIFRMHPGHVSFRIMISGRAAHSSKPDLGHSAIKEATKLLNILNELEIDLQKERRLENFFERPFVTFNIGTIKGGQAVNIVPDHCEIEVGYRPLPGDNPKEVFHRFSERLQSIDKSMSGIEVEIRSITPALLTDDDIPLKTLLMPHAATKTLGAASFATDAGNFAGLGIKSLIFGPGSIDVAHRADEFIEGDALISTQGIIADIIRRRCE